MLTVENVERIFTYQPATPEQKEAYAAIREAGIILARAILHNAPNSADRSTALRCVREARMWANAAVALEGEV
jgi:Xaa-Pro aminopeptidase